MALRQAIATGRTKVEVNMRGMRYILSLERMTQHNTGTRKTRLFRRQGELAEALPQRAPSSAPTSNVPPTDLAKAAMRRASAPAAPGPTSSAGSSASVGSAAAVEGRPWWEPFPTVRAFGEALQRLPPDKKVKVIAQPQEKRARVLQVLLRAEFAKNAAK